MEVIAHHLQVPANASKVTVSASGHGSVLIQVSIDLNICMYHHLRTSQKFLSSPQANSIFTRLSFRLKSYVLPFNDLIKARWNKFLSASMSWCGFFLATSILMGLSRHSSVTIFKNYIA